MKAALIAIACAGALAFGTQLASSQDGPDAMTDEEILNDRPSPDINEPFHERLTDDEIEASRAELDEVQSGALDEVLGNYEADQHPVVDHSGVRRGYITSSTLEIEGLPETMEDLGQVFDFRSDEVVGYWAPGIGFVESDVVEARGFDVRSFVAENLAPQPTSDGTFED